MEDLSQNYNREIFLRVCRYQRKSFNGRNRRHVRHWPVAPLAVDGLQGSYGLSMVPFNLVSPKRL